MRVNGSLIREMVVGNSFGRILVSIKVIGRITWHMGMVG